MRSRSKLIGVLWGFCAICCSPALAAEGDDQFKSDIESFLNKLDVTTHGVLRWESADNLELRRDGDAAIAVIKNARLSVHEATTSELAFDHIEIRRTPAADSPDGAKFDIVFPSRSTVTLADGTKTSLSLTDATASIVLEEAASRFRETRLSFAGARMEHPSTGDWISFGPLSFSSKLESATNAGWSSPIDFELRQIEFLLTEVPVRGAIDHIAYNALTSGRDLAALNQFRDRMDELRQQSEQAPEARADALLDLLPRMPALFTLVKGEAILDGLALRAPTGEPIMGLAKASIGGALTGLSGDTAAWRVTLRQAGLTLATSILDPKRVPGNLTIDVALENVAAGPLASLLDAAASLRRQADDAELQRATARMIAAAAMLSPVLRIYQLALDTQDVGLTGTAQVRGSPLAPKGYKAEADVAVRGFDALPELLGDTPFAEYLPVVKILAGAAGPDTKFHLTSAPPQWMSINGNDLSRWFVGDAQPGQPRSLRPAQPPLQGNDVELVQHALKAAKISAPQSGIYDGATAAAVAQFQKQRGLNIDGVVDAMTRDQLGLAAMPPSMPQPQLLPPPRR